MHDAAAKGFHTGEVWHMRCREVAIADDHLIKDFVINNIVDAIMCSDREFLRGFVISHHADRRREPAPFAHISLFYTALNIVPQNSAGREGSDRLAEMFFECVIGEFQAFLRSV